VAVRIFISHSHEDHTLSAAVAALLTDALGLRDDEVLNTSHSGTGLQAGSAVTEGLAKAMSSAEVCLVLITPGSGGRPWVQFEAGGAYFGNKRVYSLLHPAAKSPPTLTSVPTRIDSADEIAVLLDAIRLDLTLETAVRLPRVLQAVSRFVGEVRAYNPEYTLLHYGNRLELQIGYGNLLEWEGPGAIALPCDNRYDLAKQGEGSQLYERTLIGQFRSRFLDHLSTDAFRAHMVGRLGGKKLDDQFGVGHTSVTRLVEKTTSARDDRLLILVVLNTVTERNGITEAAADAPDVWRAYECLWKAASRQRPQAVAAPLFGPGQSGTLLSRQQSCLLAVLAAVCVALQAPIYPRIRLLCHDREGYRALNIRAVADAVGLERGPRP